MDFDWQKKTRWHPHVAPLAEYGIAQYQLAVRRLTKLERPPEWYVQNAAILASAHGEMQRLYNLDERLQRAARGEAIRISCESLDDLDEEGKETDDG